MRLPADAPAHAPVHVQFGAFLDPVADKLMVCVAVVLLSMAHQGHMVDVALPTAITVTMPP
jgi:phosphatidylglycerophosphate synthase